MDPIKIKLHQFLVPNDTKLVTYAENQPEYIPLPTMRTPDGRVVSQWELTPEERLMIENGVPITLVLHTFNQKCRCCGAHQGLTPVQLAVGGMDLR